MSIAFAQEPVTGSSERSQTRLRLTARGRLVLAAMLVVPLLVALSVLGLGLSRADASSEGPTHSVVFEEFTVGVGETLWGIAEDVAPGHDPRDVINDIMRLNALSSATVVPGQVLAIPADYAGS